jgi:C1A family cysteine protease
MAFVGFDVGVSITNTDEGGTTSVGAFLVKNSYGTDWGDRGYGWVPYDYLLKHQSIDWWTITRQDWLDATEFGT